MSALGNVAGGLSKKIGPLKAWQWGAAIGGGILLYSVMRGRGMSLGGAKQETATDTGITGGSSGTYAGPGYSTATSDAYNPPVVEIKITDDETLSDKVVTSKTAAEYEAEIAANKARENARVAGWAAWGEKWKTQAYRNARNASRSSGGKKPATKKKGTSSTYRKPKTNHAAPKRNERNTRTISEIMAARKRHVPREVQKHGGKVKK